MLKVENKVKRGRPRKIQVVGNTHPDRDWETKYLR